MKKTKRRLERFSFFDHTGMERHFEHMAAKGWMVEKAGALWRYRRCEPRKLRFAVTFYPRASMFDPEPTEEELTFREFCERTGWKFACSSAQLQIFYNEDPDAVPIDTDPVIELETLQRTFKRAYLPASLVLLGCCLMQFAMLLSDLATRPLYRLSSSLWTCSTVLLILVAVLLTVELGSYASWRRKALKAARRGEFLVTGSHTKVRSFVLLLAGVTVLLQLGDMIRTSHSLLLACFALMALCMAGVAGLTWGIRALLRRLKAPKNLNRALTCTVPFVLGTAGTFLAVLLLVSGVTDGRFAWGRDAKAETYEYRGMVWRLYRDELPLVIEDLLDADTENYSREKDGDESVFLGRFEYAQSPRQDAPDRSSLPELSYEIVSVKLPFLYDFCVKAKLREAKAGDWVPTDPAPWGAERAWLLVDAVTGERQDRYLLSAEKRIVEIGFTWTPDEAQMGVAGEKLL